MGRKLCSPQNDILIGSRGFQRQIRLTKAMLHFLLQGAAEVSACWHSPEELPFMIFIGLTPLAFVWRDITYKAAGGFGVRVNFSQPFPKENTARQQGYLESDSSFSWVNRWHLPDQFTYLCRSWTVNVPSSLVRGWLFKIFAANL